MTETKFTKGKWKFYKSTARRNEYHVCVDGVSGVKGHVCYAGLFVIAQIGKVHTDLTDNTPEAVANAALITASPEMYNELFRALAVIRNPQAFEVEDVCADIERVLAAARGEETIRLHTTKGTTGGATVILNEMRVSEYMSQGHSRSEAEELAARELSGK